MKIIRNIIIIIGQLIISILANKLTPMITIKTINPIWIDVIKVLILFAILFLSTWFFTNLKLKRSKNHDKSKIINLLNKFTQSYYKPEIEKAGIVQEIINAIQTTKDAKIFGNDKEKILELSRSAVLDRRPGRFSSYRDGQELNEYNQKLAELFRLLKRQL